jgi:two-component system copper resistance phosphate regulon response regulator CusR
MPRILIIEDETKVARFIQKGLRAEGIECDVALTGDEGLRLAAENAYDVLIIDLMLPGRDGYDVISELRSRKNPTSILVLSARDALHDKLKGFEVGADDYLPKPFAFEELLARIHALSRRSVKAYMDQTIMKYADLTLDLMSHQAVRAGRKIELTTTEYRLLEFFLRQPEVIFSRAKIGEAVWREQFDRESNVVDVYMMYVRKKIDGIQGCEPLLHTVRGRGYVLRAAEAKEE